MTNSKTKIQVENTWEFLDGGETLSNFELIWNKFRDNFLSLTNGSILDELEIQV